MAKYKDKTDAGASKKVPFVRGENWHKRHARRLTANLEEIAKISNWCHNHGYKLEIKNDGHYWIFKNAQNYIEWWPSSAKLVINKKMERRNTLPRFQQGKRIFGEVPMPVINLRRGQDKPHVGQHIIIKLVFATIGAVFKIVNNNGEIVAKARVKRDFSKEERYTVKLFRDPRREDADAPDTSNLGKGIYDLEVEITNDDQILY